MSDTTHTSEHWAGRQRRKRGEYLKDGNKLNNLISNLTRLTKTAHAKLHHTERLVTYLSSNCKAWGGRYSESYAKTCMAIEPGWGRILLRWQDRPGHRDQKRVFQVQNILASLQRTPDQKYVDTLSMGDTWRESSGKLSSLYASQGCCIDTQRDTLRVYTSSSVHALRYKVILRRIPCARYAPCTAWLAQLL